MMHPVPDRPNAAANAEDTSRWRLPDLLDFDYYVDRDEERLRADQAERKRLGDRDRRLYREHIAGRIDAAEHSPKHRAAALRRWLGIRRGAEDPSLEALLPGSSFARGQRLVTFAFGVVGFCAGIGVAATLLHYDGEHPVNVSWYLFVLVGLQVLLLAGTAIVWYARRSRGVQGAVQDLSLLGHLLKPLFTRSAAWVQRQRLAHMPPDVREQAQARRGLIGGHFALYGPAALLPMLIPPQIFGICFNLGVIVTTMALEWFTDLAFGWGTALNVDPGTVHAIARFLALPWGWLWGEGVGVPTLEQVEGTRISLKDPLLFLDAEELRSWRWFLVLAVITYGLLPRLVLLMLSLHQVSRTLNALPFTHQRTQALYARMITPQLQTEGTSGHGPEMPIPSPLTPVTAARAAPSSDTSATPEGTGPPVGSAASAERATAPAPRPAVATRPQSAPQPEHRTAPVPTQKPDESRGNRPSARHAPGPAPTAKQGREPGPKAKPEPVPKPRLESTPKPTKEREQGIAMDACVLLLHVDVADVLEAPDHEHLQTLLHGLCGWRVAASATFGGGSAMAKKALSLIEGARWESPPARVALIADGSQPPITETLRFLRSLRAAAGEHAQVLLTLVGDPEGDDPLPPLPEFEFQDWQRKVEQLSDPYLRLEMLAGPAEPAVVEETD